MRISTAILLCFVVLGEATSVGGAIYFLVQSGDPVSPASLLEAAGRYHAVIGREVLEFWLRQGFETLDALKMMSLTLLCYSLALLVGIFVLVKRAYAQKRVFYYGVARLKQRLLGLARRSVMRTILGVLFAIFVFCVIGFVIFEPQTMEARANGVFGYLIVVALVLAGIGGTLHISGP